MKRTVALLAAAAIATIGVSAPAFSQGSQQTVSLMRVDVKPLATRLIHDFGGIGSLLSAPPEVLRREGLSDAAAAALKIAEATALRLLEARIEERPVLSSWDALGDYLQAAMSHKRVEEVRVSKGDQVENGAVLLVFEQVETDG